MATACVKAATAREGLTGWISKTIRFRCSLSYLKLFELPFRALEDPRPFDPDQPPTSDLRPPVERVPDGYDVLVERHRILSSEVPVIERLPNLLRYAPRQMVHYYTDLRGGPERAFQWMSSKTRATLSRKVRAYRQFCGGEIRWRIYRSPEELSAFYVMARELARKTYQERLFDSGLPGDEHFRAEMHALAARDSVRAFLLFHGDKPIAYLYTPAPDGFLVYEYLGYDPEYAAHSPGAVLQYLAFEALFAEQRFPLYYWGYGYSQTKQTFSTGQVLAADLYYFRPTFRNIAAVRLHYSIDAFSAQTGAVLDRLKLKQRIKRWLKQK